MATGMVGIQAARVERSPSGSGRYRKLPALSATVDRDRYPAGQEGRCARMTGHTLTVTGDRITCRDCGAAWVDEGF